MNEESLVDLEPNQIGAESVEDKNRFLKSNLLSPSSTDDQTTDFDVEKKTEEEHEDCSSHQQQQNVCIEKMAFNLILEKESLQKATEVSKEQPFEEGFDDQDGDCNQTKNFRKEDLYEKFEFQENVLGSLDEVVDGRIDVEEVAGRPSSSVESEIASEVDLTSVMSDQDDSTKTDIKSLEAKIEDLKNGEFPLDESTFSQGPEQMNDPSFCQVKIGYLKVGV